MRVRVFGASSLPSASSGNSGRHSGQAATSYMHKFPLRFRGCSKRWRRDINVRQFVITKNKVTEEKKIGRCPKYVDVQNKNGGV